jgi:hypothetical protein
MFPEHWERGTSFCEIMVRRGIPISYVPIRDGTRSKCDGNVVPETLFRNEERVPNLHPSSVGFLPFAVFSFLIFLTHREPAWEPVSGGGSSGEQGGKPTS